MSDDPDFMPRYYARDGEPLTFDEWATLTECRSPEEFEAYKRVARDEVGPYLVSTVWLGLDHNFFRSGPPLIFETMVFAASEGPAQDFDCLRWSTLAEAEAGHAEMVTLVRATMQTEWVDESEKESGDDRTR